LPWNSGLGIESERKKIQKKISLKKTRVRAKSREPGGG